MKSNSSAKKIKTANIEITVIQIGRKWLANGGAWQADYSSRALEIYSFVKR